MSEYQYYEFQAVDRPLSKEDREYLRDLSSRAQITATSFVNTYEWGDFRGSPAELMARCFDLHLYLANWGSRRMMIKLPARMIDRRLPDLVLEEAGCAQLEIVGEDLILDIGRDELDVEDWSDGSGLLAAMAPLRADVLAGDLRFFYLLWLLAVETEACDANTPEPLPGLGPLTAALEGFAEFFQIDADLVRAACERSAVAATDGANEDGVREMVAEIPESEKTELLVRLFNADPHVAAELRAAVRKRLASQCDAPAIAPRTAGELLARAQAIRLERERARAEEAAAEAKRQAVKAEKARRVRLETLRKRGESVWREAESEIERRNPAGYDKAAELLSDLRAIASESGALPDFEKRLQAIRERHARKGQFIARLTTLR